MNKNTTTNSDGTADTSGDTNKVPAVAQEPFPASASPQNTSTVVSGVAPKIGDIVGYVLDDGYHAGDERPAIVTRIWGDTPDALINLQVFTDGRNDYHVSQPAHIGLDWRSSVERDEADKKPGTWHRIA